MTLEALYQMLKELDLPLAYNHFKESQKPPYVIYLMEDSSNFGADNKVYHQIDNKAIELYTDKKDRKLEKELEELLDEKELFYEKEEAYIEKEAMYRVRYEL